MAPLTKERRQQCTIGSDIYIIDFDTWICWGGDGLNNLIDSTVANFFSMENILFCGSYIFFSFGFIYKTKTKAFKDVYSEMKQLKTST